MTTPSLRVLISACVAAFISLPAMAAGPVTAVKAGRLIDVDAGKVLVNQVLLI